MKIEEGKSFRDYVTEYQFQAKNTQLQKMSSALGVDILKLEMLVNSGPTEANLNVYRRFDDLKKTVDREKAKAYFENVYGTELPAFELSVHIETLLRDFVLRGGCDLKDVNRSQ